MRFGALALVAVLAFAPGCDKGGGDPEPEAIPTSCGLPEPDPKRREELVPDELLLEVGTVSSAVRERGGFLATVNMPLPVTEALTQYRTAVEELGFDVISEDNEIFEAEMYLQRGKDLGAIQIRRTLCDDVSFVFINVIKAASLGKAQPLPVPSGARTPTATPTK